MNGTDKHDLAVLQGGIELTITRLSGEKEPVLVRQLPVKLYPKLLEATDDEIKRVALLCDKPVDWAESLTAASHTEIVETGEKLNADFFSRWLERKTQSVSRSLQTVRGLGPELLESLVKKAVEASPISLPKSPSPAA